MTRAQQTVGFLGAFFDAVFFMCGSNGRVDAVSVATGVRTALTSQVPGKGSSLSQKPSRCISAWSAFACCGEM